MIINTHEVGLVNREKTKPWVFISAYDVSTGASSEGHVAFNIIRQLSEHYRIIQIGSASGRERV